MTEQEKEILFRICFAVSETLDALKYSQWNDKDEYEAQRRKAEREIEEAMKLIKELPTENRFNTKLEK